MFGHNLVNMGYTLRFADGNCILCDLCTFPRDFFEASFPRRVNFSRFHTSGCPQVTSHHMGGRWRAWCYLWSLWATGWWVWCAHFEKTRLDVSTMVKFRLGKWGRNLTWLIEGLQCATKPHFRSSVHTKNDMHTTPTSSIWDAADAWTSGFRPRKTWTGYDFGKVVSYLRVSYNFLSRAAWW